MAPQTAALVFRCSLFCLFLCVNCVSACSYTRQELLSIRTTTPADLVPVFLASAAELAAFIYKRVRRKRGKRGGALVRLRRRGTRTPLPGIFLSNVRSLSNKMDELELLMRRNRDFSSSPVLCFTETWLNESIPDCSVQLDGFSLYRADRQRNLSGGKTRGGGICLYINNAWSTDVTVVSKHCSPDLEYLFINCKPFYSPRSNSSVKSDRSKDRDKPTESNSKDDKKKRVTPTPGPPAAKGRAPTPPATKGGAPAPPTTKGGPPAPPATKGGPPAPPATKGGPTAPPATKGGTPAPPATKGGAPGSTSTKTGTTGASSGKGGSSGPTPAKRRR